MEFIEVYDERQRFVCLRPFAYGKDKQSRSHTYSSAYYNSVMAMDFETAGKILAGETTLEYKLEEGELDEQEQSFRR